MCTRRHFLKTAGAALLVGPALLEESWRAAAQARAAAATAPSAAALFDLQKLADGVYLALARPQLLINSNACIIVNEDDVMVVDTHSKLSAARALIAQIRRQITPKPVRYIVNTHFHWDHAQGNHAYQPAGPGGRIEILSSEPTRQLLAEHGKKRLAAQLTGDVAKQLEEMRQRLAKTTDAKEKAALRALIAQGEAYQKEMRDAPIDLPTLTFDRSMVVRKKEREIHLFFLGRGHTGGDVVIHLPKERIVATGDLAHGFLPWMGDSYPNEWPATIDKLRELEFDRVSPGHAGVQEGKAVLASFRNYIEELTSRVQAGVRKGQSLDELKKEITPASLRTLQADGYGEKVRANMERAFPAVPGAPPLFQAAVAANIEHTFQKLKS